MDTNVAALTEASDARLSWEQRIQMENSRREIRIVNKIRSLKRLSLIKSSGRKNIAKMKRHITDLESLLCSLRNASDYVGISFLDNSKKIYHDEVTLLLLLGVYCAIVVSFALAL